VEMGSVQGRFRVGFFGVWFLKCRPGRRLWFWGRGALFSTVVSSEASGAADETKPNEATRNRVFAAAGGNCLVASVSPVTKRTQSHLRSENGLRQAARAGAGES